MGAAITPLDVLHVPPWLSPALEPGAVRGSPAQELSVGVCRRTVAFGKGLAAQGSCGCWLAHLGLHCRARGATKWKSQLSLFMGC